MKRNLVYPSTVDLSDHSAQSIQISEMRAAFRKIYGERLISAGVKRGADVSVGIDADVKGGKLKRSILIVLAILKEVRTDYDVFTREIFFAVFFACLGKRVVWECHQSTSIVTKFVLRCCSILSNFKVLSISKALCFSREIPISPKNKYYFHDCVSMELLNSFEHGDSNYFSNTGNYAVYTGALHKGRDVDSLEPLFEEFPDWNFVIAGGKPLEAEKYSSRFSKYKNVTLLGRVPREEVMVLQKSASVLLYPLTKTNGLWRYTSPLKLFEYMAAKRPIVGSNIGSVAELIDQRNAFVFEGEEGIVEAFRAFLSASNEQLLKMIDYNYSSLVNQYNWDERVKFIVNQILFR